MNKIPFKDRYVIEDGIPTIRKLRKTHTGEYLPIGTDKEVSEAIGVLMRAVAAKVAKIEVSAAS